MKRSASTNQRSIFEVLELEEARANPETCLHRVEQKTDTDWGPPYGVRMTWTCEACKRVRGRVG